jgi:hypothetical protein
MPGAGSLTEIKTNDLEKVPTPARTPKEAIRNIKYGEANGREKSATGQNYRPIAFNYL